MKCLDSGSYADRTCARRRDNTAVCWGYNGYGQVGDGTTTNRPTTSVVLGLANVSELTSGRYHTCARRADRTVVCWGLNDNGQLGDGTSTTRYTISPTIGLP